MHKNPYAEALGTRDPLQALAETPEKIRRLVSEWSEKQWNASYEPGKWTGREILIHLAQTELALTTRVRFALSEENYRAQPFSQDAWMAHEAAADARTALDAYLALRRLNVLLFRNLSAEQRRRTFQHPEYGELSPEWVAAQLAGHDLHHLAQLERI
ncbi:MAG TPA: DinB family protein [Vicinamibacterales bacterium]|jgi:hypothetical protein|nr:DinB family protein [Vicinamibacterales bacterium]